MNYDCDWSELNKNIENKLNEINQDKSNGIWFIISSLFYKKKNNFYYFPKIENILANFLLKKCLIMLNKAKNLKIRRIKLSNLEKN